MLLIKVVYRKLSNAFESSGLSIDCPMLLNKAVYLRLSNVFE